MTIPPNNCSVHHLEGARWVSPLPPLSGFLGSMTYFSNIFIFCFSVRSSPVLRWSTKMTVICWCHKHSIFINLIDVEIHFFFSKTKFYCSISIWSVYLVINLKSLSWHRFVIYADRSNLKITWSVLHHRGTEKGREMEKRCPKWDKWIQKTRKSN